MPWGDVASLRPVKKELERILSLPPTDRRPWSQNIRAATNAEKMTLLESILMEMLRGDGGGMTAGARRELLWRDFLYSESNLFGPLPAQGLGRDADYAFTSGNHGVCGISHKSVGYTGGILALSWGNNPVPLNRLFESPIFIVCYRKQTRGRWQNISHGVYLIPLDYCQTIRNRLGSNNRTDHLIDQALLAEMLEYSASCSLFVPLPYVHGAGRGKSISDWTEALGRIGP
jgi:hypothetical protein